jgi:hypothetical protein
VSGSDNLVPAAQGNRLALGTPGFAGSQAVAERVFVSVFGLITEARGNAD